MKEVRRTNAISLTPYNSLNKIDDEPYGYKVTAKCGNCGVEIHVDVIPEEMDDIRHDCDSCEATNKVKLTDSVTIN